MPVELRTVRAADIPAITAIHAEQIAGGSTGEYRVPSSEQMRSRVDAVVDAGCPYLVADRDGAVVGDADSQASRRLHERFGFRTVGVFSGIGRKHGRWLDSVQLQRTPGSGDTTPSF